MCRDWLCGRGNNGICYFQRDPNRIPHRSGDLTEDDWDELDTLHDEVLRSPNSQRAASDLGVAVHFKGCDASFVKQELGDQRFREMKERYCEAKPRLTRKVTLLRSDDAAAAVAKIRELGEEFVTALKAALT